MAYVKRSLLKAIVVAVLCAPIIGFASFYDGNALVKIAREFAAAEANSKDANIVQATKFKGYVAGVHDALDFVFCTPDGVTDGQTARVVQAYLDHHPELLHRPAGELVRDALLEAFQCAKVQNKISAEDEKRQELAKVAAARPDWKEIRDSKSFKDWLQLQPPTVKTLADSWKADDAILLIDLYKRDVQPKLKAKKSSAI